MALQAERLIDRLEDFGQEIERDVRRTHKRLKQSLPSYLRGSDPLNVLAAPVVYSMIVPIALLDLWASVYQWICFPLFGISRVGRNGFMVIDRHKLGYLNGIEKVNCAYCSYANGVIAYVREIAARTETYWCPIQHERDLRAPHDHYRKFVRYEDASGYRRRQPALRRGLKRR